MHTTRAALEQRHRPGGASGANLDHAELRRAGADQRDRRRLGWAREHAPHLGQLGAAAQATADGRRKATAPSALSRSRRCSAQFAHAETSSAEARSVFFFDGHKGPPRPSQPSASNSGYPAKPRGALPDRDRPPGRTSQVRVRSIISAQAVPCRAEIMLRARSIIFWPRPALPRGNYAACTQYIFLATPCLAARKLCCVHTVYFWPRPALPRGDYAACCTQ